MSDEKLKFVRASSSGWLAGLAEIVAVVATEEAFEMMPKLEELDLECGNVSVSGGMGRVWAQPHKLEPADVVEIVVDVAFDDDVSPAQILGSVTENGLVRVVADKGAFVVMLTEYRAEATAEPAQSNLFIRGLLCEDMPGKFGPRTEMVPAYAPDEIEL